MTPASRPLTDRLRAIPTTALIVIGVGSFVVVPFVAGMFDAGTTSARANPANETGRTRTNISGLSPSLPATMLTSMPKLTGSTPTATYAAPATVASTGYAAGGGDGTSSGGADGGGASGSSNARHHQPKAADQARTAPAGHPRVHLVPRSLGDPHSNRHATAAATGPIYHRDLPPPVRPVMPMRAAPAPQAAPPPPRFAFVGQIEPDAVLRRQNAQWLFSIIRWLQSPPLRKGKLIVEYA